MFQMFVLSSEWFPSVRSLNANVSDHSVCSIFIGEWVWSVTVVEGVGYCTWKGSKNSLSSSAGDSRGARTLTTPPNELRLYFEPFHVQYPTFSTAVTLHTYSPMKMQHTECSETLAFKLRMPDNHPEESTQEGETFTSSCTMTKTWYGISSIQI
jgi:hypothetical protein